MTSPRFKRIALYAHTRHAAQKRSITALLDYFHNIQVATVLETETAKKLNIDAPCMHAADQLQQHADLLLVVGGDGNMLSGARIALDQNLPILGINRGTLGFLADINPDAIHQLSDIVEGHYTTEARFFLQVELMDADERLLYRGLALNDVVLMPGGTAHMLDFSILIDNQSVCQQRADGLIITTPTGSTAYALSAGGPILHPSLNALAVVPMLPHKLSSRPIVVDRNAHITVQLQAREATSPCISCDGQASIPVPPHTQLRITTLPQELTLIHPLNYNYYQTLRSKLGWEHSTLSPMPSHDQE
jgi:NAD+ kinase